MDLNIILLLTYLNIIHFGKCSYIIADLGDDVTLNCSVNPNINEITESITWYKYSEPADKYLSISFTNYTIYGDDNSKILAYVNDNLTYSSITIFGIDATDKGFYGCKFLVGDCTKEYTNQIVIRDTVYYAWFVYKYHVIIHCYIVSSEENVHGNWRVRGIVTSGVTPNTDLVTHILLKGSSVIQLQVSTSYKDAVDKVICRASFDEIVREYSINMITTLPSTLYDEYGDAVDTFNVIDLVKNEIIKQFVE